MRYRNIGNKPRWIVSMGSKILVESKGEVELRPADIAHSGSSMAFFELSIATETVNREKLAEVVNEAPQPEVEGEVPQPEVEDEVPQQ